jgi:hypothetical protein
MTEEVKEKIKIDSIHFREVNHHCPDLCKTNSITIHSRQEKDGQLGWTDWFTGEKSYLTIRFCPFCGKRIRAFPFDRNWGIQTYHEKFEKWEKQIAEESAPEIKSNPFDLLMDDEAP